MQTKTNEMTPPATASAELKRENANELPIEQARRVAQVAYDLHHALGINWGDDPYSVIDKLRALPPAPANESLAGRDRILLTDARRLRSVLSDYYWGLIRHAEGMPMEKEPFELVRNAEITLRETEYLELL